MLPPTQSAAASAAAGADHFASRTLLTPHLQQLLIDRIDAIGNRGSRIVTGHYFRAMGEPTASWSASCSNCWHPVPVGLPCCGPSRSAAPLLTGVAQLINQLVVSMTVAEAPCRAAPLHLPAGTVDMANPAPLGFMAFSLATCLCDWAQQRQSREAMAGQRQGRRLMPHHRELLGAQATHGPHPTRPLPHPPPFPCLQLHDLSGRHHRGLHSGKHARHEPRKPVSHAK